MSDELDTTDRRVRRTHTALLGAFNALFLGRRYGKIRVGDIIKHADVGRSTFYDHYRDKDELLIQSMSGMLDVLADVAAEVCDQAALEHVLRHFWENRDTARHFFLEPSARHVVPRLSRELAQRIERRLESRLRKQGEAPLIPNGLIAAQAAEAQWALIRAWLAGKGACSPEQLARALRRSSQGSIAALV